MLKNRSAETFFGLQLVWKGGNKISVSDPSRTIVDLLDDPSMGGGMRPVSDMFKEYLRSKHPDLKQVYKYALKLKNRTIIKRLGFLLEHFAPEETRTIERCREQLSRGNSQLDPALPGKRLVTRWRLWVPGVLEDGH